MKEINHMRLRVDARSCNEGFCRLVAGSFALQLGPTLEEVADIKTAVSEAVTNAIVHAYPDRTGEVVMEARIYEDGSLELVVSDDGIGIQNVEKARAPFYTTSGSGERSGMGFTMMETFMDEVTVDSQPGAGTTVTMRKYRSPRETPNSGGEQASGAEVSAAQRER